MSQNSEWHCNTLMPVVATEQSFHIRTGTDQEHGDSLRRLSHCGSKCNTLYQHGFALCYSSPFSHRGRRLNLPVICTPWCVRFIWKAPSTPALHNLVGLQHTTSFCFRRGPTLSCKYTPSWEKGALVQFLAGPYLRSSSRRSTGPPRWWTGRLRGSCCAWPWDRGSSGLPAGTRMWKWCLRGHF